MVVAFTGLRSSCLQGRIISLRICRMTGPVNTGVVSHDVEQAPRAAQEEAALSVSIRQRYSPEAEFALDVDFAASAGFTILFGASGAGKTTLLDCVAGLAKPESGRITVANCVLFDSEHRLSLPVAKRRVGYVFQTLALFPHFSVEQNVQYGLAHLSQAERTQRSSSILQAFRIAHLARRS